MINTIASFLGNSSKSVSNWKKENRPIITFLYKYFCKEELEEFLETGEILKLEFINDLGIMYTKVVKKFTNNMNKFKDQNFSYIDIEICLNIIESNILDKSKKISQFEMIEFLINKDNDDLLNIKDEVTRCALISSLSILSELEFKILRKESFSMTI